MTTALVLPVSSARKPQSDADLAVARRVLKVESEALLALSKSLDGAFGAAVDLLMNVRGRVIVSGIGKSGHVGRKIAATFASTGTPAQFVHPAEASHGDLGMVTAEDVALIISNSGETRELSDLLSHAGRWRIPVIAITARTDSTLARAAAAPLILPPAPEACPMGLAPTTSTTMALALGDALAVALMERRAFNPDRFRMLHPGGTLGALLLRVEDLMISGAGLPLIPVSATMEEAVGEMTAKALGLVGVVDERGALVGIITDGDLRRHIVGLLDRSIPEVMTSTPLTVRRGAMAVEGVAAMNERKVTALFVVDAEGPAPRPVGLLHIHDCLRAGVK
ncbi:KpsF/GutQ family sugar-phosphate isomerase [Neomegalonema sp.]|uniref:KpsF/GutQ family sugar-phosphate isomerase n=1 Tax=Neomegalonema sp. TaxID=2039713 RepID=UPI0026268B8B|nr:KpsF/GutQ family sugar-phosphate isomerase [Neomegalonema sp.]MDD2869457.1 KpsF/GutQ family sugar-phosphate isomerase [Neomegalonema sp.]